MLAIPASVRQRLILDDVLVLILLDRLGDRIGLGLGGRLRLLLLGGLDLFLLGELGLQILRLRLGRVDLLDHGLGLLDRLGRVLDALGELGELFFANQIDGQRFRRCHLEGR